MSTFTIVTFYEQYKMVYANTNNVGLRKVFGH